MADNFYSLRFFSFVIKVLEHAKGKISKADSILPNIIYDTYHNKVEKKIEKDISGVLNHYDSHAWSSEEKRNISEEKVWVMWWQEGEEPYLVRKNLSFMKNRIGKSVVLINENNIGDYIKVPDEILEGLKNGTVTFAIFSDYVRTKILYEYGGVWMDSTILVESEPKVIFDNSYSFVTIKGIKDYNHKFVAKDKWAIYCIGGAKKQKIFKFLNEGISWYILKGHLPDYFLIDYLLDIAYKRDIDCIKQKMTCLETNNVNAEKLSRIMNKKFSRAKYEELLEETSIFKLSNKVEYSITDVDGNSTFYNEIYNK